MRNSIAFFRYDGSPALPRIVPACNPGEKPWLELHRVHVVLLRHQVGMGNWNETIASQTLFVVFFAVINLCSVQHLITRGLVVQWHEIALSVVPSVMKI